LRRGSHVILNGELLPRAAARLSVDDAGFLLGDGVFETLRLYDGRPFLVEEHLARLFASLRAVQLRIPWNRDQLLAQIRLLVERNDLVRGDGRLRLTVSRGPGAAAAEAADAPTLLITADPYTPPAPALYDHGVDVRSADAVRHAGAWYRVKSTSRQTHVLSQRQAQAAGCFETLHWNDAGLLTEGCFTNVFVVDRTNVLCTPRPEEGCLKGVTRNAVLTIANESRMPYREGNVDRDAVTTAEEMFLTGSLVEIVPVRRFDGRAVGARGPGPVTQALQRAYRSFVQATTG
jgi:branched-chain amino acid aminotransferase